MLIKTLQRSTMSFGSPTRSLPNTMAALSSGAAPACSAKARGVQTGGENSRNLAETAAAKLQPSRAAPMSSTTRALFNTSPAPLAKAMASGSLTKSAHFGVTSTRSVKPIVFIARATEPMLPARLVSTRTKRKRLNSGGGLKEEVSVWVGFIYNSDHRVVRTVLR